MAKILMVFLLSLGVSIGMNMKIQMISDVINSYDRPTAVIAKVCWGKSDKMSLAAQIMSIDSARTIQFTEKYNAIEMFPPENMLIILDLDCEDREQFLKQADLNKKFEKPYRWMLLSSGENMDLILSQLENLSIIIDSDVAVVREMRNDEIVLNKVYKIDSASDFITESFGTWTLAKGFNMSAEAEVSNSIRRKNLRGKTVVMSSVIVDERTKTEIYELKNFVTDNIAKATFHNILPLYAFINATTKLIFTDTWGYYINNSWNGMIGQIMRGEADLCGAILMMRLNRLDPISFLTRPIKTATAFVFREPSLSLQNNLFVLPFKSTVWMCVGALIVILIIIMYINAIWEVKKSRTTCDDPTVLRPDISDIAIFVIGAVVQQGSNSELKGALGRVVTFIMFMIFLFLYTSYSANIVALLQSSSDQIRTLSDLLSSKFELGVEDQPYNRHYFTTATDRVRKAIYDNKVARTGYKPNFMTIEEGVKKLQNLNEPFAFHMNLGLGYKFVEQYFYEHEKCGIREIEYIQNGSPWVSCRRQSPYKEIYKIGLARILEHGISDRINRLIYARKPACTSRGGSFGSVDMVDFHPVLLCLLYGMVASVLLLLLEILIHKLQRQNLTKIRLSSGHSEEYIDSDADLGA